MAGDYAIQLGIEVRAEPNAAKAATGADVIVTTTPTDGTAHSCPASFPPVSTSPPWGRTPNTERDRACDHRVADLYIGRQRPLRRAGWASLHPPMMQGWWRPMPKWRNSADHSGARPGHDAASTSRWPI